MALNLDEIGDPLAIIKGGKHHGRVICVDRSDKNKGVGYIEMKKKEELVPMVNTNNVEIEYDQYGREIGQNYVARNMAFVVGMSGSGKSTYCVQLAKSYRDEFPKGNIYVFSVSNPKEDPAYRSLYTKRDGSVDKKFKAFVLDESLIDSPILMEDLEPGSFVIFDDASTVYDDKVKKVLIKLQMRIMECGRKRGLHICVLNHNPTMNERALGRTVLNECNSFTFFPKGGSFGQLEYALKNHMGLTKQQIDYIRQLPNTRWVTIFRNYPMVVMTQKCIFQLV